MEHLQHGMARKWDRHYRSSRTVLSVALMIFGVFFMIPLVVIWPQFFSATTFDSRLAYHLMIDAEDYWTCNKDFTNFVIHEPADDDALFTIFVFSVSNAAGVLQTGQKPTVTEQGPYGYKRSSFKYDISFNPGDQSTISFKEYNLLDPLVEEEDLAACTRIFFGMDRNAGSLDNLCASGVCNCKNHDTVLTILNPLFLKVLHEDSSEEIIARFSSEVFLMVQDLLSDDFVNAIRTYLIPTAFQEVGVFRQMVQLAVILNTGYDNMISNNFTDSEIETMLTTAGGVRIMPSDCGLSVYGIPDCPWNAYNFLLVQYNARSDAARDLNFTDMPSPIMLYKKENIFAVTNFTVGMPRWVGVCTLLGTIPFNANRGFASATDEELTEIYTELLHNISVSHRGGDATAVTDLDRYGSEILVQSMCNYLFFNFFNKFTDGLRDVNNDEFRFTSDPVPCSPLLAECVWQWGYQTKYGDYNISISKEMAVLMADVETSTNTNPNSLYFPANSQLLYNTYRFCHEVKEPEITDTACMDIEYTRHNATFSVPAHLWAVGFGASTNNMTFLYLAYDIVNTESSKEYYQNFACEMADLPYEVYSNSTSFHDDYFIRYLNKYKDPDFDHNFTVGKWDELGLAQWGGGFTTYAAAGVRNVYQLKRDGMWRYGGEVAREYIENYIEYSSWSLYVGYPQTFIYDIEEIRSLLNLLADTSEDGVWFRRFIVKTGTTFYGNNEMVNNGMFYPGEVLYITEANQANFSCDPLNIRGSRASCDIMNVLYSSNETFCREIEDMYDDCIIKILNGDLWVTNCDALQTSLTSPTFGIQCDRTTVYGMPHPYRKSRGNVVFEMVFSLNAVLVMQSGLWCESNSNCDFKWGGLFMTTQVKQLLFEGYTESSVIKYLQRKHEADGVSFSCVNNPYLACNKKNYNCTSAAGVIMGLPNNQSITLAYSVTPKDQYFAPYFLVNKSSGEMLWPYAMDEAVVTHAQAALLQDAVDVANTGTSAVIRITNPFYVLYAAWHTKDVEFNKYYQCQKRMMGGLPGFYNSCYDKVASGRNDYGNIQNLLEYRGNSTIFHYNNATGGINVTGSTSNNEQHQAYFWDGFSNYPYAYFDKLHGPDYYTESAPVMFDKHHGLKFELTQEPLLFEWQRDTPLQIPLIPLEYRKNPEENGRTESYYARRFVEDKSTWDNLKLGQVRDTFGMPYDIPEGMSSIERIAGVPAFVGTPHYFGNFMWGGLEYLEVLGVSFQEDDAHKSFMDYDPITGQSLRAGLRQQVHLRVERGSMFPNIISSQDRCVVPTRVFSGSSGLGCFAYYPILWYEDAKLMNPDVFFNNIIHYYERPSKYYTVFCAVIYYVMIYTSILVLVLVFTYTYALFHVFMSCFISSSGNAEYDWRYCWKCFIYGRCFFVYL